MSTSPAIKPTRALTRAESKDLIRDLAGVRLSNTRRDALRQYGAAALRAFAAPIPQSVTKKAK